MKTLIIGGGKGCRSILDLTRSTFLKELSIDVVAVADINSNAPGLKYAQQIGLRTFTNMKEALELPGIEVIIELTGKDAIAQELYRLIKPGVKLIDHAIVRLFWDINDARQKQFRQFDELKNLELKLDKERLFLQSIFDNLSDLAIVIDTDQKIIRVNARFAEFIGLEPKELINKKCYDVLAKTEINCDKKQMKKIIEKVVKTGKPHSMIHLTPPPNENHWEITRSPIFDEEGNIYAILSTWHMITEKVMLHREIESAEQKFKSFIYSAQDWISIKNLEGRYVIVNPVIANAFHMPTEYFIGKKPEDVFPDKLTATIKRNDELVIQSKQYHTFDEIIPIDGHDHNFHTVRFPLTDYNNEIIGVCTIARDITNEIKLQEQLVQSEKLAALGKLAAGVAHEINNPLTGILAYAEDLLDEFNAELLYCDDLKVIIRETLRCSDIVKNLLDFARQDKPKLEIISPNKIVDNSLHLIKRLPQFKDIKMNTMLKTNLPMIKSDPMQIQQVLLNLILNATDAMKYKGKIIISTGYDFKKGNCIISVEDNGPGIPENLIDKIFEPFFSTKGTNGLGLAVSWGIIERHGGTIEIDIADTGGAIFHIILPAHGQN